MLHQFAGGGRDQDLPAVARLGDPGRPVHLEADVVVPAKVPSPVCRPIRTRRGSSIGQS